MNVIRHDYIFFNFRNVADIFFGNMSVRFRDDVGIVPYDLTEDFLPVLVQIVIKYAPFWL